MVLCAIQAILSYFRGSGPSSTHTRQDPIDYLGLFVILRFMAKFVDINDSKYPTLLKNIPNPPKILYYKGEWGSEIFENCLAVVGSRKMTSYGTQIVQRLVMEIASRGVTIVSGFMSGVDAQAHKIALDAGGKTIAVMPCGIDLIHPGNQKELYNRILGSGGLILSEYEGRELPQLWTYPKRNRIVAGLSKSALVIEAALGSGSLITADYACKFNRSVFAVPGSILSSVSAGTLNLIKTGKAKMVTEVEDVLSVFSDMLFKHPSDTPFCAHSHPKRSEGREHTEGVSRAVLDLLESEPLNIDELSRETQITPDILGFTITTMLLDGTLSEEGGRYYVS